ncbi:hypothetical protein L9G74_04555 [Shewanella sp. C32]|uniref:Uncharacterized protein n=1 Tax=Shewanella electrica TaxID=515560 RepID=A0ABT2FHA9_9GAMM|nr:hypothetical protein [Shewanella electrica]MCH1923603.1 hypothetical protein [Shewanella electrica]MCS4555699.1 hypothetical protein [Shewanella electrica]
MLYYPKFIAEAADSVIGVYDQKSGDSPHGLKQLDDISNWRVPTLHFLAPESQVDDIVAVNMPLTVMRRHLAKAIAQLAPSAVRLIPIPCVFAGQPSSDFCVLWPLHQQALWDLDNSDWAPLAMPHWPPERPFYLYHMRLLADVSLAHAVVANQHHSSMLVVNDSIKQVIDSHCRTVRCEPLEDYQRDIRHKSSWDKVKRSGGNNPA